MQLILVKNGFLAEEKLELSNTRLVISIARKYIGWGVEFEDLVQEGNVGLLRAAKKFDFTRGNKFSTYATWWIRQAITRAVNEQARSIRIPVYLGEKIRKMNKVIASYQQEFGKNPGDDELMSVLDINSQQLNTLRNAAKSIASLNSRSDEDDSDSDELGDLIPSAEKLENMSEAEYHLFQEMVAEILESLSPRSEKVLRFRFGLDGGGAHTLEEISKKFGLTRERIRQLQADSFILLKTKMKKKLEGYY